MPNEQAEALEKRHASSGQVMTALFDGEDRGFIEAGRLRSRLRWLERSLYEKVLVLGGRSRLEDT